MSEFYNLDTLGLKERQNLDVRGSSNWTVNICIRQDIAKYFKLFTSDSS